MTASELTGLIDVLQDVSQAGSMWNWRRHLREIARTTFAGCYGMSFDMARNRVQWPAFLQGTHNLTGA
ncbi:hypothetical protein D3Y55_03470 [Mesorhizobium sp. DCY119]|jgi:hypothetical protein|nr:hypothetical protein D3Y55_03470 [Mesorhizobium sp. DCY119]